MAGDKRLVTMTQSEIASSQQPCQLPFLPDLAMILTEITLYLGI